MSGHNRWTKIKHKKEASDAKKSKLWTKLIKELTVAARMGGGEPGNNPRLRKAIQDAKGQQMPADTIKRALQRGTGEIEGAAYEEILYEGTEPGTVIHVDGYQAKDGSMTANGRQVVFADGRKLFLGSSGTGAPRDGTDPNEPPATP